jgi:hypothetical protein
MVRERNATAKIGLVFRDGVALGEPGRDGARNVRPVAYIVLTAAYFVAAIAALAGIWLTAREFVRDPAVIRPGRWTARRGPLLIAVGIALGLIGNMSATHLPLSSAPFMAPSSSTDGCDNNDGLFGLCGAGQLN